MKGLVFYGVPGKMSRRFAAVVIASEAFAVFLFAVVAYGLAAASDEPRGGTWLVAGCVVAVLCLLDAGLLRRPWGVTLGWLLQLVALLGGVVVGGMFIVGAVFLALWVTALVQGRKMEELTAAHLRAHPEADPDADPETDHHAAPGATPPPEPPEAGGRHTDR